MSRLATVLFALSIGCASMPGVAAPDARGMLPAVEVVGLRGEPTQLVERVRGRVTLLSLWATWCEACQRELAALSRLDERLPDRAAAVVLGVAVGEPHDKVAQFAQSRDIRYSLLVDEKFQLADALGQRRVPATLVLDRSGHIVYVGGAFDAAALAALRRALADATEAPRTDLSEK